MSPLSLIQTKKLLDLQNLHLSVSESLKHRVVTTSVGAKTLVDVKFMQVEFMDMFGNWM